MATTWLETKTKNRLSDIRHVTPCCHVVTCCVCVCECVCDCVCRCVCEPHAQVTYEPRKPVIYNSQTRFSYLCTTPWAAAKTFFD